MNKKKVSIVNDEASYEEEAQQIKLALERIKAENSILRRRLQSFAELPKLHVVISKLNKVN